jgi:transposase-like protein
MSIGINEEIKRWTAGRKSALILDITQERTTVSDSSRQFDLTYSEVESWIDQATAGMENAPQASSADRCEHYETQLKALQEAYGHARGIKKAHYGVCFMRLAVQIWVGDCSFTTASCNTITTRYVGARLTQFANQNKYNKTL